MCPIAVWDTDAHNRRRVVWEDAGQRRQVAREIGAHPEQVADRLLVRGFAVEVAHG